MYVYMCKYACHLQYFVQALLKTKILTNSIAAYERALVLPKKNSQASNRAQRAI